jgi:hypothetical protein
MVNALKLAAAFARLNQPATDKEGLTCGKLVLQNSRGFWNGADLDLSVCEYRIIELLASRPGQYFTFRRLIGRNVSLLTPSSKRDRANPDPGHIEAGFLQLPLNPFGTLKPNHTDRPVASFISME